jgi:G3E family GTPase
MRCDLSSILPPSTLEDPARTAASLPGAALLRVNFIPGVRQHLGWRGMHECACDPGSLTTRIAGFAGVFGLQCIASEETPDEGGVADFNLSYFPSPEEERLNNFSIEAGICAMADDFIERVRDFPAFDDLSRLFTVAKIHCQINKFGQFSLSLEADEYTQIVASDGLKVKTATEVIEAVAPGECDQNLDSLACALPFFENLVASMTHAVRTKPTNLQISEGACERHFYDSTGGMVVELAPDINRQCLEIGWATYDKFCPLETVLITWQAPADLPEPYDKASWLQAEMTGAKNSLDKRSLGIKEKPKLIVLTGFLGSGKTSFLTRFIEYQAAHNGFVAVVQNEIGQKGLDASLLGQSYAVSEMDEGCVCCTLAGNLKLALADILRDYQPDFVVLETTGLANPANLISEINELEDDVTFSSITSMVDARLGLQTLSEYEVARDQVRLADVVLLNKISEIDEENRTELESYISKLNPVAPVYCTDYGDINPAKLYGINASWKREDRSVHEHGHTHKHHHSHHHTHLDDGISSMIWKPASPVAAKVLSEAMRSLPANVLRVKGIIDVNDCDFPQLIQYVPGTPMITDSDETQKKDNFLIFIGKDIQKAVKEFSAFF